MLRGSIPPTGLPLPFISAGSTSLLVFMSAIGVVLNVDRQSVSFRPNEVREEILKWIEFTYTGFGNEQHKTEFINWANEFVKYVEEKNNGQYEIINDYRFDD